MDQDQAVSYTEQEPAVALGFHGLDGCPAQVQVPQAVGQGGAVGFQRPEVEHVTLNFFQALAADGNAAAAPYLFQNLRSVGKLKSVEYYPVFLNFYSDTIDI